jgi:hypothetical protein
MIAVMNNAAKCAKSVAAWKMMVLASSMERAEQSGRRRGLLSDVIVVGGPRRKQSGRGDELQREVKSPNPMMAVDSVCVGLNAEEDWVIVGTREEERLSTDKGG